LARASIADHNAAKRRPVGISFNAEGSSTFGKSASASRRHPFSTKPCTLRAANPFSASAP